MELREYAALSGSDNSSSLRPDVQFYSEVKIWLTKIEATDRLANGYDSIRNVLDKLVIEAYSVAGKTYLHQQMDNRKEHVI